MQCSVDNLFDNLTKRKVHFDYMLPKVVIASLVGVKGFAGKNQSAEGYFSCDEQLKYTNVFIFALLLSRSHML